MTRKKTIYKSFSDKKEFNKFLSKAGKSKQFYELRFKGKKFRLGNKRADTIKRAKVYARAASAPTPEQFVKGYLKGLKSDKAVTITISTKEGNLYINKVHRPHYKAKESEAAFLDLLDEILEKYEIDNYSIVGISAKGLKKK